MKAASIARLDRPPAPALSASQGVHPFHRRALSRLDLTARPVQHLPPSFFIVGAPRCGTTSLSAALREHARISFSKPKETHFFVLAPDALTDAELKALYIELHHRGLGPQHQAVGDGSVSYLYTPDAIRRALCFDERARFIAMVRSPLDMLPSYHARMVYDLQEDVTDFARAWALQRSRAAGQNVPKRCLDARLLQYGEIGRLGAHVEQLFEVAGRDRCLIVVFDDFRRDPRATYRQVLEFVGIEDDGRTKFSRKAENRGFKSPWLQQFVMNPPPWTIRLVELSNRAMLRRLKRLRRRIEDFNTFRQGRPELQDGMREILRDHFADDVQRLSTLIDRDLSHWLH